MFLLQKTNFQTNNSNLLSKFISLTALVLLIGSLSFNVSAAQNEDGSMMMESNMMMSSTSSDMKMTSQMMSQDSQMMMNKDSEMMTQNEPAMQKNSSVTTTSKSNVAPETNQVGTTKFSGELLRKQGELFFVKDGTLTKEFQIANGIIVKRDTMNVTPADLKVGDKLTLTTTADGKKVLAVDVVSGKVLDTAKYAIPLLIICLILVGVIWYFYNKSTKGHIRTKTVTKE